jgi:putative FmdB family regulatory protein
MPTYDYRCRKCGHQFELFHGIKDDAPKRCPKCRGRAQRVPAGGAGVLFKGSGFYVTDYRSKAYKEKARQEKSTGGGGGSTGGGGGSTGGGSGSAGGGSGSAGGGRGSTDGGGGSAGGGSGSAGGKTPSGG